MMNINGIKINEKNNNLELISKLMNSVAIKYDCTVKYDSEKDSLNFKGDDAFRKIIAEETLGFFS